MAKQATWGPGRAIVLALATGFGLGLAPVASGTFGTLLGLPLVVALRSLGRYLDWGLAGAIGAAIVLAALAIPICHVAERHFGKKDDGRIVADEYLTFPLCVLGLPWPEHPWLLAVAFLAHRVFDIAKPPPAYQIQRIGGGPGIVLDDVIASLYALAFNHAVWQIVRRCWLT